MKGKQTLELNHETVREALEQYLNTQFVAPVTVLAISADKTTYGSGFSVECEIEPQEQKAEQAQ